MTVHRDLKPSNMRTTEERDAIARDLGYPDAASIRRPLAKTAPVDADTLRHALSAIARLRTEIAIRDQHIAELQAMVNRSHA